MVRTIEVRLYLRNRSSQQRLGSDYVLEVWSESSMGALWIAKDPGLCKTNSEDLKSYRANAQADLSLWRANRSTGTFYDVVAQFFIRKRELCSSIMVFKYSRTWTSLGPWKFVGSSRRRDLIIAPGREAYGYNLGMSFRSSIQYYVECAH